MLNKSAFIGLGVLVGVAVGVTCTYSVLRRTNRDWVQLKEEGHGLAYKNEALFDVDIPMPTVQDPQGQAKFVDRGIGKGEELGFLVKDNIGKLDTSKLPAKYKRVEQRGEYTIEPTENIVYASHLEFTLKDADGFVLTKTKSDSIDLWSGQENTLQGFAQDSIPEALVKRTKAIEMQLVFDKCETCRP
jgi:hypothetical protein